MATSNLKLSAAMSEGGRIRLYLRREKRIESEFPAVRIIGIVVIINLKSKYRDFTFSYIGDDWILARAGSSANGIENQDPVFGCVNRNFIIARRMTLIYAKNKKWQVREAKFLSCHTVANLKVMIGIC